MRSILNCPATGTKRWENWPKHCIEWEMMLRNEYSAKKTHERL